MQYSSAEVYKKKSGPSWQEHIHEGTAITKKRPVGFAGLTYPSRPTEGGYLYVFSVSQLTAFTQSC